MMGNYQSHLFCLPLWFLMIIVITFCSPVNIAKFGKYHHGGQVSAIDAATPKYMLEVLSQLYLDWLKTEFPVNSRSLLFLRNAIGTGELFKEKPSDDKTGVRFVKNAGMPRPGRKVLVKEYADLTSWYPVEWTFQHFVSNVLSGSINTDDFMRWKQKIGKDSHYLKLMNVIGSESNDEGKEKMDRNRQMQHNHIFDEFEKHLNQVVDPISNELLPLPESNLHLFKTLSNIPGAYKVNVNKDILKQYLKELPVDSLEYKNILASLPTKFEDRPKKAQSKSTGKKRKRKSSGEASDTSPESSPVSKRKYDSPQRSQESIVETPTTNFASKSCKRDAHLGDVARNLAKIASHKGSYLNTIESKVLSPARRSGRRTTGRSPATPSGTNKNGAQIATPSGTNKNGAQTQKAINALKKKITKAKSARTRAHKTRTKTKEALKPYDDDATMPGELIANDVAADKALKAATNQLKELEVQLAALVAPRNEINEEEVQELGSDNESEGGS